MPRRKREERYLGLQCVQCDVIFDAVREDAKTCSARCRVAFNRDKKAAAKMNARRNATLSIVLKCKNCATMYDVMKTLKCDTCGCLEHVAY